VKEAHMSLPSGAQPKDRAKAILQVAARIEKPLLEYERDLATRKWFDYRFTSPVQATQIFIEACDSAFRDHWGANWNMNDGKRDEYLAATSARPTLTYADFWKARQDADVFGLPYPFFVNLSIEDSYNRRRGRLPRPSQVFRSDYSFVYIERIMEKWTSYRKELRLMVSQLPQYRTEAFRSLPAQIAHREWVINQIKLRYSDPHVIGRLVHMERLLPLEMAVELFDSERLAKAARAVEGEPPVETAATTDGDFWPGCFMVPHAFSTVSSSCSICPVATHCGNADRVLRDVLVRLHGNDNPAGELHRTSGRRKRKKLAA
jgi:hypothetical protein